MDLTTNKGCRGIWLMHIFLTLGHSYPYQNNPFPANLRTRYAPQLPPPRPRFDLNIPSYAYIPERYTGHMQYLPNPFIYATEGTGHDVGYWGYYQTNYFRDNRPTAPSYDPIYEDLLAYVDGHPVSSPTTTTTANPVANGTKVSNRISRPFLDATVDQNGKKSQFRPCTLDAAGFRFGICVDDAKVVELCIGRTAVKSAGCGTQQSCCLESTRTPGLLFQSNSPTLSKPLITVPTSETPSSLPKIRGSGFGSTSVTSGSLLKDSLPPCKSSHGIADFGVCVKNELIGMLCKGKFVSKRPKCDGSFSCCADHSMEDITWRPQTDNSMELINSKSKISQSLRRVGQIGGSTFGIESDPQHQSNFLPCVPEKSAMVGVCVNDGFLGQFCVNQIISKSRNCGRAQSCCVDASHGIAGSQFFTELAPTIAPFVRIKSNVAKSKFHSPNSHKFSLVENVRQKFSAGAGVTIRSTRSRCIAFDSGMSGLCVDNPAVSISCVGKALSRSTNCINDQTCCTDLTTNLESRLLSGKNRRRQNSTVSATNFVCGSTEDPFSFGYCVEESDFEQLCAGKSVITSEDCQPSQSCCGDQQPEYSGPGFSRHLSDRAGFLPCRSADNSQNMGLCVETSAVSVFCGFDAVWESEDCSTSQRCCIYLPVRPQPRTPIGTTTTTFAPTQETNHRPIIRIATPAFQQCIPIIKNFEIGLCVDEDQVNRLCTGRLVAPSRSCAFMQSCCSYFPEVSDLSAVSSISTSTSSTTMESSFTKMSDFTVSVSTSTSGATGNIISSCVASLQGNDSPQVGACISKDNSMVYCAGNVVSLSDDCNLDQLCCLRSGDKK